jgi:membrane protein DedA with SNARE-associated domain
MITLNFIRHFVEQHAIYAYLFIILGVIIEGEIVVILAGIFADLGSLNFIIALIMVLIGGIVKSIFGYSVGLYLRRKHSERKFMKQAEYRVHYFLPRFAERPFWSIFISRFLILGLYWFTLLYAGYKKIELEIFVKAEAASLAIWSITMLSLGFFFSFAALAISRDIRNFLLVILGCFIAFFIIEKIIAFIIELFSAESDTFKK